METSRPIRSNRLPLIAADAIEHHVADLSVTAGADVTLGQLREELSRHHQWLPIDGPDSLIVSQAVALNSTGPLRLGYGAWRDLLLGAQFINERGDLISAGGRTVKNVAGYDLTKLLVGQGGDLGRIVTITTRTYRLPTHALLARFNPGRNAADLLPTPLRPQWAMLTAKFMQCGYLGDEQTIRYIQQELPGIDPLAVEEHTVEQDVALRAEQWTWPQEGMARLTVPPAKVRTISAGLSAGSWIADPAFGVILLRDAASQTLNLRGVLLKDHRLVPMALNAGEIEMVKRIRGALRE